MTSTLSSHDPRAVTLMSSIRAGDAGALEQQLRDMPELATTRIVDAAGVSRTALHIAADWPGHFPNGAHTVALLIRHGADVNAPVMHAEDGGAREAPLHWAASSDDVAVLDALLDGGADIEMRGAVFTGGTAMSDAVIFAQWRAARRLLERGASTTIWQAAALGALDRVRTYCDGAPAPTAHDITNAFWHACRGGQLPTATFLRDRGADLQWIGHDHRSPLDAAKASGDEALVQWLQSALHAGA